MAYLSLAIWIPILFGVILLAVGRDDQPGTARWIALVGSIISFLVTIPLITGFDNSTAAMQFVEKISWIPRFNVNYHLGVDGISVWFVLLTAFITVLVVGAGWEVITDRAHQYMGAFLIMSGLTVGVFSAVDGLLFYVFFEATLIPMYILIGIWGGPRRVYAAIKFFLYTLAGGVLMLIAMLMFYFNGGMSFDLQELASIAAGQGKVARFDETLQLAAFIMLFIGFAIKLPSFPFHTWLPDAHVEAPTPISMILAGVLLKMGGYGIIRIAMPLCPYGAQYCAYFLVALGVFSIIYGAFAAMAQTDFKRLVAYSSVSHMGYVLLGLAVWKISEGKTAGADYWAMGINAAMFQMIAHGISSTGMFFMVGVLYDRVHHRDLNKFGGIAQLMPEYSGLAAVIFFAGLGLPGLCGFVGEIFSVLSCWNFDPLLAIIAASGVILTAGYILWTMQRVYLGPEYKGPHPEGIIPFLPRERLVAYTLVIFAIGLGVFPNVLFKPMDKSISGLVQSMSHTYDTHHGAAATVQTTQVTQ